jgi:hypothetical protein
MAAQTIKVQIEELVGSTSVVSLDDWAGDALDKLILLLPYDRLFPFASTESCTYTGSYTELTAKNKRIFEVLRAPSVGSALERVCEMITPGQWKGEFANSASMYYPTDYDPRWTIYGDIVKVIPSVAGMVVTLKYIALTNTVDTTGTGLTTVPYECEYLVVLDVAQRVALNKITGLVSSVVLTISVSVPSVPTLATVSYINAASGTVSPVTIGTIPAVPTYTNITIPTNIATVIALFDTAVSYDTLSVTTIAGLTLASVAPTIPAGFATAMTAFDTAMTNEDIELANLQLGKAVDYLKQHEAAITLYNQQVEAEVKAYQQNTGKSIELVKTKVYANTETAKTLLAKANVYLQQYQTQVQESVASFQKDLKKYEADIQKIFEQAKLLESEYQSNAKFATDINTLNAVQTAEAILKNDTVLIQDYHAKITSYGQQVQAAIGVYQTNLQRITIERERLTLLVQHLKQEYYEQLSLKFGINMKSTQNAK